MKKVVNNIIVSLLGATIAIGIGVSIAKNSKADEVDASNYSVNTVPTTIDCNDTTDANIRSYYSSLNSLATNQRQGTNLLKNLKPILKNNQKYFSYGSNATTAVWQAYEIVNRDWSKSPASAISGYNSSTKKITGYSYNSTDPYVRALYINRDVNNQTTAWSDHQQTQWGINQEHVWPKSCGFDDKSKGAGARGDLMHLWAGNGYANNIHSNNYYGYVDRSEPYTDCGNKYSNLSGNLSGKSSTLGGSYTVFEPQDSDKGDIARAIFYMAARYNYFSGSDSDGIDAGNPNLQLTQSLSDCSDEGYTSTTSNPGKMGIMTDLLAWHHADPVDEIEIHRNNLLYTNFTNNRNPFIDFPQWADFIWGSVNYNGRSYVSHSTEPTGYATPSSDTINGYNGGGSTVSVTGVSLNKNSSSIQVGSAETLEATVAPSNATNKNVSWASSNTSVATVSSGGVVRGVSEGNSTITVRTSDGGYTATCIVTVTASGGGGGGEGEETLAYTLNTAAGEIPIATSNTYANYAETDSGYKWTINCGSKQTNSPVGLWLGSNDKQKAKMILSNGSYSEASGIASAIGVSASNTYYAAIFQQSGGTALSNIKKVTLTYDSTGGTAPSEAWVVYSTNNGTTWNVFQKQTTLSNTGTDFEVDNAISSAIYGFVIHSTGYCQFKVPVLQFYSYEETPSSKALDSITLDTSDAPTTFYVGDEFSYEGLAVTANYDDGTSDIVTPTSVSTPSLSSAGQKTVTVSYTEGGVTKTATYTITVNAVTLTSIEVSEPKTAYYVGDSFVKPTVTATFSNGSTSDVTNSATFSGYNMSSAGNQTVTVSYTIGGVTKTTTYNITVTAVSLTSIAISGYTTDFKVGDTFSFGGTVTANYNNGSTADVTASATFSGYNMSSVGSQTVTVSYGGKSTTYQITVSDNSGATDSTQFALVTSTSDLEAGKSYIITNGTSGTVRAIAVTSNANNRKSTEVAVSNGKITRGSSAMSLTLGGSSGAWTFATENYAGTDGYLASGDSSTTENRIRVISTAGTATIAFNGDAATINLGPHSSRTLMCFNSGIDSPNGGFACYSAQGSYGLVYLWKEVPTKDLSSISLDTTNVQKTFSVGSTFNYDKLVVTAHYSDSSSATVTPTSVSTPNMFTTGNKTVTVTYTENGISKTANYSIIVNSNPTLTWTAPTIKVYSGTSLTGTDVNGWAITYNDGVGHETVLTYSQVTVKLGGSSISIPYSWSASDDGKTLCVSYSSLTTATTTVDITQTINPVNMTVPESSAKSDLTFTAKCNGSGTADDSKTWTITSDATSESIFDSTNGRGIHYGTTSDSVSYIALTSSSFTAGKITKVEVNASTASGVTATVGVAVGGVQFGGEPQSITSSAVPDNPYTFTGEVNADTIVVTIAKPSSATKALYCKSVVVTYTVPSSTTQIANVAGHEDAQKAVVKFAKAFNDALGATNNCTTNLDSAWSTATSAWNTFLSDAAALGSTEEAYAKNLIKYATAQWTSGTDSDYEYCLERVMATYEKCVNVHGKTAFMSDVRSVDRIPNVNPIKVVTENSGATTIVLVISLLSVATLGGYLVAKKRKQY